MLVIIANFEMRSFSYLVMSAATSSICCYVKYGELEKELLVATSLVNDRPTTNYKHEIYNEYTVDNYSMYGGSWLF